MSSIDDKGDSSNKRIEEACKPENKVDKFSDVLTHHKVEEHEHSISSFSNTSDICLGDEERTSKNEEISKSAGTDEELSSDTQEDEIKLRWDDDDSQDLPAQTIKPDETIEEQGKSTLNKSETHDGDISGETPSLSTISRSTDTKSNEHGLNKPDMMLSIPENMFDKEKLKDFNADTSSDKDSLEEEDNNLSDLLSKVNAEIAETVAAIDEDDEMDCELQLSTDEDIVETQLKETTIESEEHIDEEKENELLSQSFEEVEETKANMDIIPEIVNSSMTEAIVKEVSADAMSSIDNLENPESSDIALKNLLVQENKDKEQDIDVKMPMTCNVDNMIPDTHDIVIPSESELRKKDMSLKISTLISSIEGEMQLLDTQDEKKSPKNTEKTNDDVVEVSSVIEDIKKEIQLLDDNEITSSETTKKNDNIYKISSSSIEKEIHIIDDKELTHPISKNKKDFADKLPSLISDLEEQIKLLDSNEEENDIEKSVTDNENDKSKSDDFEVIGEEIGDIVDNVKEPKTKDKEIERIENESSKEEDEIARAIKAIETDTDSLEPLQPAVLKVTDELSEISVLEETDQPSISLVLDDDDDSIEELRNDVPMSVDESEVSVIPDSDDEAILILDGENETDDTQKDELTTAEIKQHEKMEMQIDVEKTDTSKMGTGEQELKEDLLQSSQDDSKQNQDISMMDNNVPTSTIEDNSTNNDETGKETVSEIEKGVVKIDLQNTKPDMNRKSDNLLDQPSTSNIQYIEMETDSTKAEKDTPERKDPSQNDDEPQPSTSTAELDLNKESSNDAPENSDQLDLLTESTRNRDDDEEQEEDDDDYEDFSHDDESSNLMTAEHSDESNAPTSEVNQEKLEKQLQSEFIDSSDNAEDANEILEKDETKTAIESVDIDENDQDVAMKEEDVSENKAETKDSAVEDDVQAMECEITEISSDAIEEEGDTKVPKDNDEEKKTDIVPVVSSTTSDTDNKEAAKEQEIDLVEISTQSPSKTKILSFTSQKDVENIVDLADSEDEVQEVPKTEVKTSAAEATETKPEPESKEQSKVQELELKTLPVKPDEPAQPKELAVETVSKQDDTADTDMHVEMLEDEVLNEEETPMETADNSEIFNLDSDDEELKSASTEVPQALEDQPTERKDTDSPDWKCVNTSCEKIPGSRWYAADTSSVAYYNGGKRSREFVCEHCADRVARRNEDLIEGIRNLTPLLELDMAPFSVELVEISDSDSEHEDDIDDLKEKIGERGAKFIEENLEDLLNDTWDRIQMDTRLADTESVLQMEMRRIEKEADEINKFLKESQATTDRIRNEVYATFPQNIKSIPPLVIYDTPDHKYCYIQATQPGAQATEAEVTQPTRFSKRRLEAAANGNEVPAKRPPLPLECTPSIPLEEAIAKLDEPEKPQTPQAVDAETDTIQKIDDDDNVDVAVVNIISSEAAPPGLPPAGELVKAPLKAGMTLYAMKNAFGSWVRSTVLEVYPKGAASAGFTSCKVRLGTRNVKTAVLPARNLAYAEPASARMTIGTRVIALFKDKHSQLKKESFYSGIVAEIPNPVNRYRYLIFFDDGYAQYANHADTRLICECHALVWEEVHPFSREFVKEYLMAYPERPMVRLHPFQSLKTEWNGKWWSSRVVTVDASLVQVHFPVHNRYEWIYRGSTRLAPLYLELQAAERHRARPMPRTQAHIRANMPVVEYTRHEFEQSKTSDAEKAESPRIPVEAERSRRAVAKKSTVSVSTPPPAPASRPARPTGPNLDNVTSRVVYYTPKNAVKPHKLVPHTCGPHCKRTDVLSLKELRTYNPLAKPLLSGWERQIVRFKGQKAVLYRAPCGRRIRDVRELHRYLRAVECDLPVDLFDFAPHTHCLAEFVLNKCLIMKKDLSQGKENVPVPCVNYYDQTLPEFCSYNTERTPTAGVPLNLDPEFLCGCDCEDDCEDKTKCACWKLTLEGARTIGLEGDNVGYVYKRLPEPLPSGIYECNSRCKCKHTCLNRVAQHPLQLKLQVFKTLNRGWGIRALNDVPKGAFLCVYAGNLLTDATANLDGLNEGDEYLAELDYIEVVEQMKEGYEEDIPETIKKLDQLQVKKAPEIEDEESSDDNQPTSKNEMEDDDFRPGYIGLGVAEFSKRLRKRDRKTKEEKKAEAEKEKEKEKVKEEKVNNEDECITISDDDEVREPSRFAAAAGMGANEFISKYRSVRTLFGEDESCYIMDAKVQGNIGRYLNHSCSPNVFVQNVFVDTHDPRFPWVAFFALSHVRAGTELTWNYNYDVGSVPGKALYCYCGAANCRGRLL